MVKLPVEAVLQFPTTILGLADRSIKPSWTACREWLSGLLKHYGWAAAQSVGR